MPEAAGADAAAAPGDIVLTMPSGIAATDDSSHAQQATVLRLSYRVLLEPPSAARVAAAVAAPLQRAKPTLLRLLSRRPAKAAATRSGLGPASKGEQPAMSAEEVTAGLHLEVPIDPLPLHLHSYGHGGESRRPCLQRMACCRACRSYPAAAFPAAACCMPCCARCCCSALPLGAVPAPPGCPCFAALADPPHHACACSIHGRGAEHGAQPAVAPDLAPGGSRGLQARLQVSMPRHLPGQRDSGPSQGAGHLHRLPFPRM